MRALNAAVALGALVILVGLVLGRRRETRAPAWTLLRCLFPSWRFFESITPAPILSYRVAHADQDFGAWQDALPPVPRTPLSFLLNPRGNLRLACQSLVERLLDDLDSLSAEEAPQSVSYRLVQQVVLTKLDDLAGLPAGRRYQFQVTLPDSDDGPCFVSAIHAG